MRVLCIAHAWPEGPSVAGIFVKRQVDSLRRSGCEVDVSVVGGAKGVNWVADVRSLRERIHERGYDVVHAQYGGKTALAAVAASRVPVVLSFCGTDLNGLSVGGRWERTYALAGILCSQLSAPMAAGLIIKSESLRPRLWRQADRARCRVIPNGVDFDLFRPINRDEARAELGWPVDRPVVLVSGQSDSAVKRLDLAERAVRLAREDVEGLVIKVLRGIEPDRVPTYLNAADVVLLTSQHEGSPNLVKEALACDVSVVSVDVGDVRRWLEGTAGCWLVERDPARLAEAIVQAVRSGGRSEGRVAVAELSMDRIARMVMQVYREASAAVPQERGDLDAKRI